MIADDQFWNPYTIRFLTKYAIAVMSAIWSWWPRAYRPQWQEATLQRHHPVVAKIEYGPLKAEVVGNNVSEVVETLRELRNFGKPFLVTPKGSVRRVGDGASVLPAKSRAA